ncbi:hypothetical protein ACIGCH_19110 [Pseudomonas helleri]|uniref:hypothetical protein n=1 Tax=Pseudomonas helleri TaxID=1608996 RepID=UPI0037CC6A75
MLKQHSDLVVFKAYGEEDGGTQEPGAQVPIHETPEFQEALKAELDKAVAAETGGLKSKNSELKSERDKFKAQSEAFVAQAQELEDQEALKSGKMDWKTLMDKRINANNQTWQEKIKAEQAEKEELRKAVEAGNDRLKQFKIKQLIGNEALKNEFFQPTAIDDLINLASGSWELTENDELVSRDQHGNVIMGKAGRALAPKEWIESLNLSRPHYFKQMPGSGGKQGGANGANLMPLAEFQLKLMKASPKEKAELLGKYSRGEVATS